MLTEVRHQSTIQVTHTKLTTKTKAYYFLTYLLVELSGTWQTDTAGSVELQ